MPRVAIWRGRAASLALPFLACDRRLVVRQNALVLRRLTDRKEWKFFAVLPKADPPLAAAWWTVLLLRGVLPAAFAIAMGVLVGAVQGGHSLAAPLAFAGAVFVLLQVLSPIHQAISSNLGDRTAAWLYDRLTDARACTSSSTPPRVCASGPSSGACCSSSPPTSSCSGCWRAPPARVASVLEKQSSTCRAPSACR